MAAVLKTLLLFAGIAALLLLGKGFPQFGAVLRAVFLTPFGWIGLGALGFWIYRVRSRNARQRARIIDDETKRISAGETGERSER